MTQGGGDDGTPKGPPEGVLADAVLKKESPDVRKDLEAQIPGVQHLDKQPPTSLPVDPNYIEPTTLAAFKDMHGKIIREWQAADAAAEYDLPKLKASDKARLEQGALIEFLLARIKVLEDALMPYANMAMMMSNARMCLIADGRPTEPAGGTWLSNVQGIQMQANEGIFFNTCDAYGRKRIQDHMVEVFEKMQATAKLQREKVSHVEAGGRADH